MKLHQFKSSRTFHRRYGYAPLAVHKYANCSRAFILSYIESNEARKQNESVESAGPHQENRVSFRGLSREISWHTRQKHATQRNAPFLSRRAFSRHLLRLLITATRKKPLQCDRVDIRACITTTDSQWPLHFMPNIHLHRDETQPVTVFRRRFKESVKTARACYVPINYGITKLSKPCISYTCTYVSNDIIYNRRNSLSPIAKNSSWYLGHDRRRVFSVHKPVYRIG